MPAMTGLRPALTRTAVSIRRTRSSKVSRLASPVVPVTNQRIAKIVFDQIFNQIAIDLVVDFLILAEGRDQRQKNAAVFCGELFPCHAVFLQIINCNIYQAVMLSDIVSKSIDGMLVVVNMYFETLYKIIKIYSKILLTLQKTKA